MRSTGRLIAALAALFGIAGSHVELKGQTSGLFFGVTNGSTIAAYTIGGTGAASGVAGSPFSTSSNVNGVAVDPIGQYLFATMASNTVAAFRVGPTGILSPAPGSPCATGSNPSALTVDAASKFVYVANSGASTITACAIGPAGALTALSGSPFSTGASPRGIAIDSTGQYLYVTSFSANAVYGYTIGINGALTPVAGSPFSSGFQPIGIATSGTSLFVANNGSQSVSAFTIGSGGALTEVTGSPYLAGVGPYGIAIPAGAAQVYMTNQVTQAISAFRIQAGGGLTTVAGSPYATTFVPAGITADPSGQFVYVTSQNSSQAGAYSIGAGGVLTALSGSPFATPGSSLSVTSHNLDENQATHLSVTVPNPAISFGNHQVTVTALDQSNNLATGYNGTVHFTSTDPGWVPAADLTLVNGFGFSNGSLKTAGLQTVTATDTLVPSITGSYTTTVVPGSLDRFDVEAQPHVTAGTPFSVTVRATDLFGNTVSTYTGTVHLTSTDAAGTMPADSTLTNGARIFSVTLRTAGLQTVKATDTLDGSLMGSYSLVVDPSTATRFSVSAPPSATAGTAFNLTVAALDTFGNTDSRYAGTVHFTSTDGQAVLPANSTLTSGSGTFSVTLKTTGAQTVTATDTVTGSITGTSGSITVAPPTLQSILVTPSSPSIAKGLTQQFTAIGTFSDNSTQNLTGSVTWASATTSVATISNVAGTQGLATGADIGTSIITATLGAVTSAADVLTVNMISQTINFPNPGNQIYGVPFNLSATATSGLTVMFQSLTANTCTVSVTEATFISLGPCTIQANQAGNGSYLPAAPVNQTLTPVLDVSGQVSVTQNGFGRNRATGLWTATMTVTNTTGMPIAGPVSVGITNLSANATMVNNTGMFQGQPYILTSTGTLGAGMSVILAIQFQNPSAGFINYIPVTYSGTLQANAP